MVKKHRNYFLKQRLIGIGMALIVLLATLISKDLTVAVIFGPVAIYTIFTKSMVITDEHYFEMKERRMRRGREL